VTDIDIRYAPGWPGIEPRWTSSAKSGIGTALNPHSRVWYTISHGILNEIYFPRVDQACTRDLGLLVTDGGSYFSEEKRHCRFDNEPLQPGVPVYRLTNISLDGRYRIEKEIFSDPYRNVVLQKVKFHPLRGRLSEYHLYALLAPHIANWGSANTGWLNDYKGVPMMFAQRDGVTLAFGCTPFWGKRSVGFVGYSDGWQDLSQHFQMEWTYDRAENGNIALTGEIDLARSNGEFLLGVGFGRNCWEAGQQVLSTFMENYDEVRTHFVHHWETWHNSLLRLDDPPRAFDLYRASVSVLRAHESKDFLGGIIASLSIPWGFNKGDEDLGGYHLVWPRDLAETAGALVAAGADVDAVRVLRYLEATQEADGHWAQNMWLDGRPYWAGLQMDETAFPILLLDLIRRQGSTDCLGDLRRWWPMVRKAATFVVCNGPVTQQDRWEEDGGYSPFTLAVEVAALLAAADIADLVNQPSAAQFLRETADSWNDNIERWTYVVGTDLARQMEVEGYYIRIAPADSEGFASPTQGFVPIKNRPPGQSSAPATHVISPDSLALVRFGLRAASDPRILNTIKLVDTLLRARLPQGPCWYRYNGDGYGEHEDGSPFDGTGIGRAWPLLAGERAHYEIVAGHADAAEALLSVMETSTAGPSHLIPEQVWDSTDIPELELFRGKPSGSACPLVWAHAEYIKLRRSLRDQKVFDQPPQTVQRYLVEKRTGEFFPWLFNHKVRSLPCGKKLRIGVLAPARVHWSDDGWRTVHDVHTRDTGLGLHVADLATDRLAVARAIDFTFLWDNGQWEGTNFTVSVE
jgi:glucoamylase